MSKYAPLGNYVVLKVQNVSDGGIVLTRTNHAELERATVVAAGPGKAKRSWSDVGLGLEAGQKVLYRTDMGVELDEDHIILDISAVVTVLKDAE